MMPIIFAYTREKIPYHIIDIIGKRDFSILVKYVKYAEPKNENDYSATPRYAIVGHGDKIYVIPVKALKLREDSSVVTKASAAYEYATTNSDEIPDVTRIVQAYALLHGKRVTVISASIEDNLSIALSTERDYVTVEMLPARLETRLGEIKVNSVVRLLRHDGKTLTIGKSRYYDTETDVPIAIEASTFKKMITKYIYMIISKVKTDFIKQAEAALEFLASTAISEENSG